MRPRPARPFPGEAPGGQAQLGRVHPAEGGTIGGFQTGPRGLPFGVGQVGLAGALVHVDPGQEGLQAKAHAALPTGRRPRPAASARRAASSCARSTGKGG